jgi:hypothetical protein
VSPSDPLVEQVRSGDSFELQVLAAQGILPLPAEELIPLQVHLASLPDEMVAGYARAALGAVEPRVAGSFLAHEAPPEVLRWFALQHPDPQLVETVLRRRDVPRDLLVEAASGLGPDLQEVLLLRQDAIVEEPAILDALESNAQLSIYARRRIGEYRMHLLPREIALPEPSRAELAALAVAELTAEDREEIERARAAPAGGEVDESTGLSEAQIRSLPVPVRIKLTRGASRTLRNILIKDSNRLVALSVLANAALTEDEIEQTAANRSMHDEVLSAIARRREWVARYGVCSALVHNPRVPVGLSVKLVARLSVRDLKLLRRDRNVPEPVRSAAERLYRIKSV